MPEERLVLPIDQLLRRGRPNPPSGGGGDAHGSPLRANAKAAGTKGVVTEAGLGFDRLVTFTWEAALDDRS